jgi:hypothetical protein
MGNMIGSACLGVALPFGEMGLRLKRDDLSGLPTPVEEGIIAVHSV